MGEPRRGKPEWLKVPPRSGDNYFDLRRLVADGDRYRAELNRLHARLVRLYPDDARLRKTVEGLDRRLASNLETLARYLEWSGTGTPRIATRRGAR